MPRLQAMPGQQGEAAARANQAGLVLLPGGWAGLILAALTGRRRKCSRCGHPLSVHASA
jgi:hypothetical protein